MKQLKRSLLLFFLIFFVACADDEPTSPFPTGEALNGLLSADGAFAGASSGSSSASSGSGGNSGPGGPASGLITAGEWNDLANWDFWLGLGQRDEFTELQTTWGTLTAGRVSVLVTDNGSIPVRDVPVTLLQGGVPIFSGRTNHLGRAELFTSLFTTSPAGPAAGLALEVNNIPVAGRVKLFTEGINEVRSNAGSESNRTELAFLVDATGSMSDELRFLQEDLREVIERIESNNPSLDVATAAVFYRDETDEYLTRHADFTNNITTTVEFIRAQSAAGGGDFPEAVHAALRVGIDQLSWSDQARLRIAFLILDAPPHTSAPVIEEYQRMVFAAAEKGILLVPITASGIDKSTEFLMRLTAIGTNGTYVFITDDSGIGDDHLEPTVGDFEVEFLSDLMVRLVQEWTE